MGKISVNGKKISMKNLIKDKRSDIKKFI